MLERWASIQRQRGNNSAAEMADVLRRGFGDIALPSPSGEIVYTRVPELSVLSVDQIIDGVCEYFSIKKEDLRAKKRTKNLDYPRKIGMYVAREMTELTFEDIGLGFNRHNTTVLEMAALIRKEVETKTSTRDDVGNIMARLRYRNVPGSSVEGSNSGK